MIETQLISISKPRLTYADLVEEIEKIRVPDIHKVTVKKDSSGKLILVDSRTISSPPLRLKVFQLGRVKRSAICCACDMGITAGTPHKTAQVVVIDKKDKTSKTRHLPLHVHCEFKS